MMGRMRTPGRAFRLVARALLPVRRTQGAAQAPDGAQAPPPVARRSTAVLTALVVLAVAASSTIAIACGGGDNDESQASAGTATPRPTKTPAPPTPTLQQIYDFFVAISPPTPTPAPGGTGGGGGGGGGGGAPASSYVPARPQGTGPGPAVGTDMSLSIPAARVNAGVWARSMGTNGQMGNPRGAWDVIWYDFNPNFPGLGGRPGEVGANAVFAGHVDYINVGPAVFYSIRNLKPGDVITVNTANGPVSYSVQWSEWANPNADFTPYVAKTGQDVITLVTCIGEFSAGHYDSRFVVRGIRI